MKNHLFLLLIMLPLLWMGSNGQHDWGDDFAQYLLQTKHLLDGQAQTSTCVIEPASHPTVAIRAYPVGFPLLLAVAFGLFGTGILVGQYFMSMLFLLLGLILFNFFRRSQSNFIAILLTLAIVYNPILWEYKTQLLSEVPFLLFLYVCLLMIEAEIVSNRWVALLGLALGFLLSIRIIGCVLPIAWIVAICFSRSRAKRKMGIFSVAISFVFFFFLQQLLFPMDLTGLFNFYSRATVEHNFALTANANNYYELSCLLFPLPYKALFIPGIIVLFILITGFYSEFRKRSVTGFFMAMYLLVILLYPYHGGGYRFLLPLIPWILLSLFELIPLLTKRLQHPIWKVFPSALAVLFLTGSGWSSWKYMHAPTVHGPQQTTSFELFEFLKKNTGEQDVVVFCKARALCYYTGRNSTYRVHGHTIEQMAADFEKCGVTRLILPNRWNQPELYDPALVHYLATYATRYLQEWSNSDFTCYRKK